MLIEFIAFIMALVYRNEIQSVYEDSLSQVFRNALSKNETQVVNAFHELEQLMKCCGVTGINDYTSQRFDAPPWCYQNLRGCSTVIIDKLKKDLPIIGGILGAILVIELLGVISAIVLSVQRKYTTETARLSIPVQVQLGVIPGRRRNYHSFA
jgi:hypothetical protein